MKTSGNSVLSLREVSARLGIKPDSLRKRIQRGQVGTLPMFKIGEGPRAHWHCDREQLESWIETQKQKIKDKESRIPAQTENRNVSNDPS